MHVSVLLHEVIDGLALQSNDTVVDATINGAGHSHAIAQLLGSSGTLMGFDADASALIRAQERLRDVSPKLHFVESNFRHIDSVLTSLQIPHVDAVLFDLGLSSNQLDLPGRGFSFMRDEPLTMTFTPHPTDSDVTARDIVNDWSEEVLADILHGFAEERFSRRIASAIIEAREENPILSTKQLADIVATAIPKRFWKHGIHPATKTFQAIRIAVNDELNALKEGLQGAYTHLAPGGRMAVISFHSLEDRIVKRFFRDLVAEEKGDTLNKKPITPTPAEILHNPRARSAKLRLFQKI